MRSSDLVDRSEGLMVVQHMRTFWRVRHFYVSLLLGSCQVNAGEVRCISSTFHRIVARLKFNESEIMGPSRKLCFVDSKREVNALGDRDSDYYMNDGLMFLHDTTYIHLPQLLE